MFGSTFELGRSNECNEDEQLSYLILFLLGLDLLLGIRLFSFRHISFFIKLCSKSGKFCLLRVDFFCARIFVQF